VGILEGVASNTILVDPSDTTSAEKALTTDPDVAAVIIEPTGTSFGRVPMKAADVKLLRHLTDKSGTLLIFDEVITGFRVAPGGAQQLLNVTPDLTTLAKILAGGLPGGAVAGRKDVLELLDVEWARRTGREKVSQYGTFNANPISASAGIAMLRKVRDGSPCVAASDAGAYLRRSLNKLFAAEGLKWSAYGEHSAFFVFFNPRDRYMSAEGFDPYDLHYSELLAPDPGLSNALRLALLVHGIDICGWNGGLTSSAHTEDVLCDTVDRFRLAIGMLKEASLV
jgi:glutamate-1-semialdehyde 2,1-aminomutase